MRVVSMSGSLREGVGKKDAKKIRKDGGVPCVIYGGKEQVHFFTDSKSFLKVVYTPEVCFIHIEIGDKTYETILQDMQFHPVTDNIYHADFMEFVAGKPIIMNVPIRISGTAPGVLKGGKIVQKFRKLKIKALPAQMPEFIDVSIEGLEIGQSVKVVDIKGDNYTVLDNKNNTIIGISITRAAEEAAAATAAAAPAVAAAPKAAAAAPKAAAKK